MERDQRAVVMRCTATNMTPADDSDAKNSHLKGYARQARSGSMSTPATNTIRPRTPNTVINMPRPFGVGLLYVATSSSREGVGTGCRLIVRLRSAKLEWRWDAAQRPSVRRSGRHVVPR